jgi:hypothetical protein
VFQFHSGETQFAAECHEQHGYLQGMGVGGLIGLSQPRYELQRVGIADNTFDQILDNILDCLDLQAFPWRMSRITPSKTWVARAKPSLAGPSSSSIGTMS